MVVDIESEKKWVHRPVILRAPYFKMQVRPFGGTRISGIGYKFASFYRYQVRGKFYVRRETFFGVLTFANQGIYGGSEAVEMSVHCGIAVRVLHVQRFAVTADAYARPFYEAVGRSVYFLAGDELCFEVHP